MTEEPGDGGDVLHTFTCEYGGYQVVVYKKDDNYYYALQAYDSYRYLSPNAYLANINTYGPVEDFNVIKKTGVTSTR